MLAKIIGIIGSLAVAVSALLPWGMLVFKKFDEETTKQVGGIELLQGQIGLGLGVVALILFFVRPKLALFAGILAIGAGVWYYVADIMPTPYKPAFGVWIAIIGGLLIALGSFMSSPKKA